MLAKIFSQLQLIGKSDLQISDPLMGVMQGKFLPEPAYFNIQKYVWEFCSSTNRNYPKWDSPEFTVQVENGNFISFVGGLEIYDSEQTQVEEIEIVIAGANLM